MQNQRSPAKSTSIKQLPAASSLAKKKPRSPSITTPSRLHTPNAQTSPNQNHQMPQLPPSPHTLTSNAPLSPPHVYTSEQPLHLSSLKLTNKHIHIHTYSSIISRSPYLPRTKKKSSRNLYRFSRCFFFLFFFIWPQTRIDETAPRLQFRSCVYTVQQRWHRDLMDVYIYIYIFALCTPFFLCLALRVY